MFPFILVCRSEIILYMQMLNSRRGARGRSRIRKPREKCKDIYFRGRLRRQEHLLQVSCTVFPGPKTHRAFFVRNFRKKMMMIIFQF